MTFKSFAAFILVGLSCLRAHAIMPIANLNNAVPNAAQPIPSQVGSCTVPTGLSEACTQALTADCRQISQCNGDTECMANRPRVDVSACDEVAPAKPQRMQLSQETDGGQNGDNKIANSKSTQLPSSTPNQAKNQNQPIVKPVSSSSGISETGDPSADVRACTSMLASAQSACNTGQADSFQSQVSGGGDPNAATAGVQNVNNVVLNCSYSQSNCSSTCGDALSAWQSQCGSSCGTSVRSAIGQLQNAKSACDDLSSNVQYLSSAANNTMNTASQQLPNNGQTNPTNPSHQSQVAQETSTYGANPSDAPGGENDGTITRRTQQDQAETGAAQTGSNFNAPATGSVDEQSGVPARSGQGTGRALAGNIPSSGAGAPMAGNDSSSGNQNAGNSMAVSGHPMTKAGILQGERSGGGFAGYVQSGTNAKNGANMPKFNSPRDEGAGLRKFLGSSLLDYLGHKLKTIFGAAPETIASRQDGRSVGGRGGLLSKTVDPDLTSSESTDQKPGEGGSFIGSLGLFLASFLVFFYFSCSAPGFFQKIFDERRVAERRGVDPERRAQQIPLTDHEPERRQAPQIDRRAAVVSIENVRVVYDRRMSRRRAIG